MASTSVACTIREIRIARAYRDHGTGNEKIAVLVAEGYCALIGYGSSAASIFLEGGRGGGMEVPRRQLGPVPPSSCFPPRLQYASTCLVSLRSTIGFLINRKSSNYLQIQIGPALSTPEFGDPSPISELLILLKSTRNMKRVYKNL